MQSDKRKAYTELVARRKACTRCLNIGLTNPAGLSLSKWDSDQIGPWTLWLGDLDARVMIVGQEWGDTGAFARQNGRDTRSSATNRRLRELLARVGIDVPEVGSAGGDDSGVFATNAALCLKEKGCQGPVLAAWFEMCGASFLRPQIELVAPKVVVCLGERAYRATMIAFGMVPRRFRAAVEGPPVPLSGTPSLAVAVYHCGDRIRHTHRRDPQQEQDWQRVRRALEGSEPAPFVENP